MLAGSGTANGQKPMFTFNQTARWNQPFRGDFDKALFRSTLDVTDHHLTGMMLIKRTSDSSFRINFSNEVGITFFDFEITDRKMTVITIFPDMDRKSLLSFLERDFRLLLFRDRTVRSMKTEDHCSSDSLIIYHVTSDWGKYDYTVHCGILALKGIDSAANGFKRTSLDFIYGEQPIPLKINIKNPSIRLLLHLSLIGS